MSKERPILFSAPMVRALLSGAKTQTRRLVKPMSRAQAKWLTPELLAKVPSVEVGKWDCGHGASLTHPGGGPLGFVTCPYGGPGDRLWVRETWAPFDGDTNRNAAPAGVPAMYRADRSFMVEPGRWKPSIYMPRWASRIELEVTAARVERLQAISEADVKAEGIREGHHDVPAAMGGGVKTWGLGGDEWWTDPVAAYRSLWVDINGAGSWALNPWVWVVEFKRVRP